MQGEDKDHLLRSDVPNMERQILHKIEGKTTRMLSNYVSKYHINDMISKQVSIDQRAYVSLSHLTVMEAKLHGELDTRITKLERPKELSWDLVKGAVWK